MSWRISANVAASSWPSNKKKARKSERAKKRGRESARKRRGNGSQCKEDEQIKAGRVGGSEKARKRKNERATKEAHERKGKAFVELCMEKDAGTKGYSKNEKR